MALQITNSNYNEVVNTDKLVVIDFWAEWCAPCKRLSQIIDELATEYEGKAVIAKCDCEENPDMVSQFGVRNLPTLLFIRNGEVVDKSIGALPTDALRQKIEANL